MKFSIITVSLNSGPKLLETVLNVLKQTCRDFEIIIKDGGSTDDSLSAVKDLNSPFVKIFEEKDSGIYDAMNEAGGIEVLSVEAEVVDSRPAVELPEDGVVFPHTGANAGGDDGATGVHIARQRPPARLINSANKLITNYMRCEFKKI